MPTQRLGGERGKTVMLDLRDLSRFNFPGDEDPRNAVNRSEWMPAASVVSKIITRDKKVLTDKKDLEEDELMAAGGFSVRITVLPIRLGRVAIWMGAAPGSPALIKAEAERRGLNAYAADIPTLGIQLGSKENNPVQARMCPSEGEILSNKWGMYPLIMVGPSRKQIKEV